MIPKKYFYIGMVFVLLALMLLFGRTMILENVNARKNQQYVSTITALEDSLRVLSKQVQELKKQISAMKNETPSGNVKH